MMDTETSHRNPTAFNLVGKGASAATYLRGYVNTYHMQEQHSRLIEYSKKIGLCVIENYCDMEYSFGPSRSPQLEQLKDAVERHRIKSVLVWSLAHLAWSMKGVYRVVDHCNLCGVRLVALDEQFDTSEMSSQALSGVVSAFSQVERALEIERAYGITDCQKVMSSREIVRYGDK